MSNEEFLQSLETPVNYTINTVTIQVELYTTLIRDQEILRVILALWADDTHGATDFCDALRAIIQSQKGEQDA